MSRADNPRPLNIRSIPLNQSDLAPLPAVQAGLKGGCPRGLADCP